MKYLWIVLLLAAGWAALAQTDLETATDAYQRGDYDTAYTQFQKLAGQGQPQAQYYMGTMLENAQGVSRDQEEAAQWYRKAADQGNAQAQNALGLLYETGTGVPKNPEKAAGWYRKAADQGFAPAQRNLGQMYRQGLGVPQDRKKAGDLLQKAADQGDLEAQKVQRTAPGLAKEAPPASTPERTLDNPSAPAPGRTFDNPPASDNNAPRVVPPEEDRYWRNVRPGLYFGINPYPGFAPPPERIEEVTVLECSVESRAKSGEGEMPSESLVTGTLYEYKGRAWQPIGSIKGTFYHMTGKFKGTKSIVNSSDQPCNGLGGHMWDGSSYLNLDTTAKSVRYICDQIPTNLAGNYRWESDRTKKCKIAQTGSFLDFTDEQGQVSKGIFWLRDTNRVFTLRALDWKDRTWATLENNDTNAIQWRGGATWIKAEKLDVANLAGFWQVEPDPTKKCFIKQTGEDLQLTDENGKMSPGHFENYTDIVADSLYGTNNLSGRYDAFTRQLRWANDTVWTQGLAAVNTFTRTGTIKDPDQWERFLRKITETEFSWLFLDAQFKTNVAATLTVQTPPPAAMATDAPGHIKISGAIIDAKRAGSNSIYGVTLGWKGVDVDSAPQQRCEPARLDIGRVEGKWAPTGEADFKFRLPEYKGKKLYLEVFASGSDGSLNVWLQYVYERQ